MARKKKAQPLSLEDSRRVQGSAADLENIKKAKAQKDAESKLKTAEDVLPTAPKPTAPAPAPKKVVGRPFPKAPVTPGPTGTPDFVGTTTDPKMLPSQPQKKRSRTRSGKKIDRKTGRVVTPKAGRLVGKGDGTVTKVTQADVTEARTTALPDAPVVRPDAAPKTRIIRDATARPTGTAVSVGLLRGLVKQAHTHLDRMGATHGQPEYMVHQTNFHEVHATISAGDHQLGSILGIHHHLVHTQGDPQTIAAAKSAAHDRLAGAGEIAQIRSDSDAANSEQRKARIQAYKVDRGE
jgi:hypothetical protein